MAIWTQRGELITPDTMDDATKTAIAQVYVTIAGLETLEDELLMFEKSPALGDWGAEGTHIRIGTALTPALAAAIKAALADAGLLYIEQEGELVDTNDQTRLDGDTITLPLDWQQTGATYTVGMVARHNGQLYECNLSHTTQGDPNWAPDIAAALWKPYLPPGEAREWRQPLGAHAAYPIEARVLHGGNTWVSAVDNNAWEPGSVGAEALWTCEDCEPEPTQEWVSGEQLTFDPDNPIIRTYQGRKYELRQNPGINIWPPPTVPALWLDLGPV